MLANNSLEKYCLKTIQRILFYKYRKKYRSINIISIKYYFSDLTYKKDLSQQKHEFG